MTLKFNAKVERKKVLGKYPLFSKLRKASLERTSAQPHTSLPIRQFRVKISLDQHRLTYTFRNEPAFIPKEMTKANNDRERYQPDIVSRSQLEWPNALL
jgi:hypothetical protein